MYCLSGGTGKQFCGLLEYNLCEGIEIDKFAKTECSQILDFILQVIGSLWIDRAPQIDLLFISCLPVSQYFPSGVSCEIVRPMRSH